MKIKRILLTLLILALFVVPVFADDSGSMVTSESAIENIDVGNDGYMHGVEESNVEYLIFDTIEYYQNLDVIEFTIPDGAISRLHAPSDFDDAGSESFVASYDGTIVGTGTISIAYIPTTDNWEIIISFDSWDVGDLTGYTILDFEYSFGGEHPTLWTTRANIASSYVTDIEDVSLGLFYDGTYYIPQYQTGIIHHTQYWTNLWESTEINDITNKIEITRVVNDHTYTSDITILTPMNTYDIGSGSNDIEMLVVGNPVYIYVTDIYSNEHIASVNGDDYCWFSGTVYDITDGSAITSGTVTITQDGTAVGQESDTTDGSGDYTYLGVPFQEESIINTSKTGYIGLPVTFTPPWSQEWIVDIYMYPDNYAPNTPAIGGMVYEGALQQAVSGATVHISNATWSDSTTSSSTGFYLFENLTAGNYDVYASEASHTNSTTYNVSAEADTYTQQNLRVYGLYDLTVTVKDSETNAPINVTTTISLSDGQSASTTTGTHEFSVDYGTYTVQATADGYYAGSEYVAVTGESATVTVYLYPSSSSGSGVGYSYPPHNVKFIVRDNWGEPIEDVTVTATATETTGLWAWLTDWLGIDNEIDIQNTTMTGTTGSDGSINFMMIEAVKYTVEFDKTGEIDTTWSGYPKDEYYVIFPPFSTSQWFEDGYNPLDVINITATKTVNATAASITVFYNDTLAQTTGGTIQLNQTFDNGTETLIDSFAITTYDFNTTFNLAGDHRGESYIIRVNATHTTFGYHERSAPVYFEPAAMDFGLPSELLLFIGMGLIIFSALFFGQTSVPAGGIVIAFESWLFFWFGWWDELGSDIAVAGACTLITVVAVLTVIMHRSKRERYA